MDALRSGRVEIRWWYQQRSKDMIRERYDGAWGSCGILKKIWLIGVMENIRYHNNEPAMRKLKAEWRKLHHSLTFWDLELISWEQKSNFYFATDVLKTKSYSFHFLRNDLFLYIWHMNEKLFNQFWADGGHAIFYFRYLFIKNHIVPEFYITFFLNVYQKRNS